MTLPPEIVTQRLVLRRFREPDRDFVFALHQNPDLARFIPTAAMTTPDDASAWISKIAELEAPLRGWWCVTLHDGTPVGAATLKPIRYSAGYAGDDVEVGWRTHADHTGHGYATEAGAALVAAGLAGGLRSVIAVVHPDNHASQAVARRAGLEPRGREAQYYDMDLEVFAAPPVSARARHVAWRGVDDPDRRDEAWLLLGDAGLTALGRQHTDTYDAAWSLDARDGWRTRRLSVAVDGDGWRRTLTLRRDADGWSSHVTATGTAPDGMPAPGIAPGQRLHDAVDCDLGLCPVTNTMPIRRLGLLDGAPGPHDLVTAWVRMPSLEVLAAPQRYARTPAGTISYGSATSGTDYALIVDADGIVETYPGLAERTHVDDLTAHSPRP